MGVVENFPSISPAEFEAGCKEIERRCVNALEATGLLSIKWIEEELLIKQQRKVNLQHRDEDHDVPALPPEVDQDDIQDFDDEQMVYRSSDSDGDDNVIVDFSITLSPTYCVPCISGWFPHSPKHR
ncbi:hypothetical protein B0A52_07536 [Exophiala mesophila]|uniref:Uncharacterized protein n=1 Tax=Exophiala mesophila TaxID=212818 RepID=A0A438MZU9_EXOME|nr:hypothetical protein B0A52_07536 [Exophiala mesophila]